MRTETRNFLRPLPLAAGLLLALTVAGCDTQAAPDAMPPPPEVSVAQVLVRSVQQWDEFTGRIAAAQAVELRPRVSGYVERVAYIEGEAVAAGQLLFVIDPRPYRAALSQAEANLERARAEAQFARVQHERAHQLVAGSAISREEADARRAAAAQAEAAVRAAEATVATARLDLQFTEVRAPIAGLAGRALITAGNLARADATTLTHVVAHDPVHVYFETDEQTYLRYRALARAGDRPESSNPVRIALADEQGYPHAASVDFVDNQLDPATGTIRLRARLPNPDGRFTPGLFARVQLLARRHAEALLIDEKAVLTDQDRRYVYVLGEDNRALRKDVQLGDKAEGLRVVTAGLSAEDKVIVRGVQKVYFPGMQVAPEAVAMSPSPANELAAAR